jgi:hypothetical protein
MDLVREKDFQAGLYAILTLQHLYQKLMDL